MKKLLIMSIALVAIMATVFTVSAFAANTVTIGDITLDHYTVADDELNDDYVTVTVNYEVAEDTTGAVDRLTFYLAAQELNAALEGEEAKVIYIDETVKPTENSFSFVIEKDRVRTAFSAADDVEDEITFPALFALDAEYVMTFKLGGANVDTAASKTIVFANPIKYGDVSGDGKFRAGDASMILSKIAGTYELTGKQLITADASGDGKYRAGDASMVLSMIAQTYTYDQLLTARFK